MLDMDAVTAMNVQRKQIRITKTQGVANSSENNGFLLLDFQNIRLCKYTDGAFSFRHKNAVVSL